MYSWEFVVRKGRYKCARCR
uniref:Uncharacterized protein n=1 Tax=Anguilla anguilla TaxID=7936 RepID=A0A0E9UBH0_ANGAN